jgi:hypothetical protein
MRTKYTGKDRQRDYWASRTNARTYDHRVVEAFARQRIDHIRTVIPLDEVTILDSRYCGRFPPNKTPEPLLGILERLPYRGGRLTSISVALIDEKVGPH